jgi:hypothetical protein
MEIFTLSIVVLFVSFAFLVRFAMTATFRLVK